MTHTVDIVEQIINEMDFTLKVLTSAVAGGKTTITVCNPFHARKYLTVNDGISDFIIDSVDYDTNTIVINGLPLLTLVLQPPFYFHGVPYKVNDKLSQIAHTKDKLPMIYLMEIIRERRIHNKLSALEKESSIKLFFLDEANYAEWDTDQHYSLAITPMENLLEAFVAQLHKSGLIGKLEDSMAIPHSNFGTIPGTQGLNSVPGHISSIFNENTSGMQLDITLPINKIFNCNNC